MFHRYDIASLHRHYRCDIINWLGAAEVKLDKTKGACWMHYTAPDGTKQRFQTTTLAVEGDVDEAMRIARLCWVKPLNFMVARQSLDIL